MATTHTATQSAAKKSIVIKARATKSTPGKTAPKRDVQRDSFDLRDLIYRPALLELSPELLPSWQHIHILDQANEGACTGFGLAALINYQNARAGIQARVSARMLFEMAKRYDRWPGQNYDYSSARGAMKGWHKHGVCSESAWPNHLPKSKNVLTLDRQQDALQFVLGAYYRILPRRSDVHSALIEAGVVYAAADTHAGWDKVDKKGVIPYTPGDPTDGGHAFAIVGYTPDGFLIQNSWGEDWGGWVDGGGSKHGGIALWTYADFDHHVWDLWVARKALPVESIAALTGGRYAPGPTGTRVTEEAPPAHEIWNHYVHIDDGQFDPKGDYPSSAAETAAIVQRLVQGADGKAPKHILLYAHGGLNTIAGSAKRVQKMQPVFAQNGIASLHFIWETGFFAELRDILLGKENFAKERVARGSSWWDRFIEGVAKPLGVPLWGEMCDDARIAFAKADAAGSVTLTALSQELAAAGAKAPKLHLVAHSAGSILFGHLLARSVAQTPIENLILYAPACTTGFFQSNVQPSLQIGAVGRLHHFYLDDDSEKDDNVALVYRKSLLYLVSNALQDRHMADVPLLGMQHHWDPLFKALPAAVRSRIDHYNPRADANRTTARTHGGFDNDVTTMNATLEIVLGGAPTVRFKKEDLEGF